MKGNPVYYKPDDPSFVYIYSVCAIVSTKDYHKFKIDRIFKISSIHQIFPKNIQNFAYKFKISLDFLDIEYSIIYDQFNPLEKTLNTLRRKYEGV